MILDEIALAAAAATRCHQNELWFGGFEYSHDRCEQAHHGGQAKALVDRQIIEGQETCYEGAQRRAHDISKVDSGNRPAYSRTARKRSKMMHDGEKDALRCCYECDRKSWYGKSPIARIDVIGDDQRRQCVQQRGDGQENGRCGVKVLHATT